MIAATIENETDAAHETRAATSARCTVSGLQDGRRCDGFPAAGLADQGERLARMDRQAQAIDRLHVSISGVKRNRQIINRKQWCSGGCPGSGWLSLDTGHRR